MVTWSEMLAGRMEGIHDLGGMHGFGSVEHRPDEPAFSARWEGRVHGMLLALAVSGNLGEGFRYAIERMDPAHYLTSPYYEHWLVAFETLLVERGKLQPDEVAERAAQSGPVATRDDPEAAGRVAFLTRPLRTAAPQARGGRFGAGDRVRVRRMSTPGHTRCPRYVWGARGVVERVHAPSVVPDTMGAADRRREPFYTVSFHGIDLWPGESPQHTVLVDLFESYLEEM